MKALSLIALSQQWYLSERLSCLSYNFIVGVLLHGLSRFNPSSHTINNKSIKCWSCKLLHTMLGLKVTETYFLLQKIHLSLITFIVMPTPFNVYPTYLFFSNVGSSVFNSYSGFGIVKLASIEFKELYQQNTQILVNVTTCCLPRMQL